MIRLTSTIILLIALLALRPVYVRGAEMHAGISIHHVNMSPIVVPNIKIGWRNEDVGVFVEGIYFSYDRGPIQFLEGALTTRAYRNYEEHSLWIEFGVAYAAGNILDLAEFDLSGVVVGTGFDLPVNDFLSLTSSVRYIRLEKRQASFPNMIFGFGLDVYL